MRPCDISFSGILTACKRCLTARQMLLLTQPQQPLLPQLQQRHLATFSRPWLTPQPFSLPCPEKTQMAAIPPCRLLIQDPPHPKHQPLLQPLTGKPRRSNQCRQSKSRVRTKRCKIDGVDSMIQRFQIILISTLVRNFR